MTTTTKTTAYTFAPDSMTCKGKTFPVEYALQPSGTVTAFVQLDDRRVRIRFDEGAAEYPAARAAAEAARDAWTAARAEKAEKKEEAPAAAPERAETIPADKPAAPTAKKPRAKKPAATKKSAKQERHETISPAEEDYTITSKNGVVIAQCSHSTEIYDKMQAAKQEERRETIPTPEVLPVTPAADPKAARAAAPEKTFAGTEIVGNGWKILFDADQQRTRIIFAANPTDAAKKVLDAAGFFYSGRMQSWNKKLTFRAYRAAQFVAQELNAIYSA